MITLVFVSSNQIIGSQSGLKNIISVFESSISWLHSGHFSISWPRFSNKYVEHTVQKKWLHVALNALSLDKDDLHEEQYNFSIFL